MIAELLAAAPSQTSGLPTAVLCLDSVCKGGQRSLPFAECTVESCAGVGLSKCVLLAQL